MRAIIKSFKHAIDGVLFTLIHENNFRIHLIILVFTVAMGLFFQINLYEWWMILVMGTMVLFAEMINTATEHTLDWIEPNHHDVVKRVKDICAGAVLVTAIGAFIMGLTIFIPYIAKLIF